MARFGKRFRAAKTHVQEDERYTLDEALEILPKTSTAQFDESIDISVRLGVDPRQADQMVRGAISLPHGVGKNVRVLVFAEGDAARAAEEAGADFVGSGELIEKIQKEGWVDFDKAVATRSMMSKVGRLGRVLGPRGLMPAPKAGTVVAPEDIGRVVREVKGGRVDFRVDKAGNVHSSVGKATMSGEALRENILALVQMLVRLKPASAKGTYIRSMAISSTMGPGIRLDTHEVVKLTSELR